MRASWARTTSGARRCPRRAGARARSCGGWRSTPGTPRSSRGATATTPTPAGTAPPPPPPRESADLIKAGYGAILKAAENRRAASVTAAEFLRRFVGDVPWAHLDIAGTAWDTGKAYAPKGGTGYGVRLLVQLASGTSE